jgi:hypothetical protein
LRLRLLLAAFLAVLTAAFVATQLAPAASAASTTSSLSVPVTGTSPTALFNGTFTPTRFIAQNGQLLATGTLTGTVTDLLGNVIGTVSQTITSVITQATGTCSVVNLTLGPLDLNLLGLAIHLDQVHLTIDAQSGPGNLVGNLVCAVTHLLDNGGPLAGVANLLNNIIAHL